jgi:pseudaminic acid synthase
MKTNNSNIGFLKKKPFFIAEISSNHNGSIKQAKKLILTAKKFGADAVKLQTYLPETMTIKSRKKDFLMSSGIWKGKTLWDLYTKAHTPYTWHKELFKFAKKNKITCFSSPFDETAVQLLEKLNCPFYKVASLELTDLPLIETIAKTKKPIIISTGTANLVEISNAYHVAKKYGSKIALLYCVTVYPANKSDFNLNNIKILKKKFNCPIGFSDHSIDSSIAGSAIVAGAEIIEKHIALDNQKNGLDIKFSIKGKEIKEIRKKIDESYKLLGKDYFYRNKKELGYKKFRRSIYVVQDIKKGEKFTSKNIKRIRPGYGLEPKYFNLLLGRRAKSNLKSGNPLKKNILKFYKIKKN